MGVVIPCIMHTKAWVHIIHDKIWYIKTTMRNCLTCVILLTIKDEIQNVSNDVEKIEQLYTLGGHVNWCSHRGKQYGVFSKY